MRPPDLEVGFAAISHAKDIPIGPATLQLIAEAFNVFNRSNAVGVNQGYYTVNGTNLGKPLSSFGAATTSAGPQFGVAPPRTQRLGAGLAAAREARISS